jgi:hypothetical protein
MDEVAPDSYFVGMRCLMLGVMWTHQQMDYPYDVVVYSELEYPFQGSRR